MTAADGLVTDLARLLPDTKAWLIRPHENTDSQTARLLVGSGVGAIRGTLDGRGFDVHVSDAPVPQGWETILEVKR